MIRVQLSAEQRDEPRARARDRAVDPRIARHLGYHEQTVRKHIKTFLASGFDRLPDRPRSGRPVRITEEHLLALEKLIDESERSWTTRQLVGWLEEHFRVRVHPDHLSRLLHGRRFRWKRAKRSVSHKRKDPLLQAAKEAELEELKKSGPEG